jgi:hypothetical protein
VQIGLGQKSGFIEKSAGRFFRQNGFFNGKFRFWRFRATEKYAKHLKAA